ncbi:dihydroneopterin aldolase, partial [Enterococcus faecalis]
MLNPGTGPSLDRVELTGISAHAYHGVEDFEKKDGQPFSVDVSFWLD